ASGSFGLFWITLVNELIFSVEPCARSTGLKAVFIEEDWHPASAIISAAERANNPCRLLPPARISAGFGKAKDFLSCIGNYCVPFMTGTLNDCPTIPCRQITVRHGP